MQRRPAYPADQRPHQGETPARLEVPRMSINYSTEVPGPNRLLSADDVAEHLLIPRSTVMKFQREGRIPSVKVGKHRRFLMEDVEAFVLELRELAG